LVNFAVSELMESEPILLYRTSPCRRMGKCRNGSARIVEVTGGKAESQSPKTLSIIEKTRF
jgi:hypothetical protein